MTDMKTVTTKLNDLDHKRLMLACSVVKKRSGFDLRPPDAYREVLKAGIDVLLKADSKLVM